MSTSDWAGRMKAGRTARRAAVIAAVMLTLVVGLLATRDARAVAATARQAARDYRQARHTALQPVVLPATTMLQRHVPILGTPDAQRWLQDLDTKLTGFQAGEVKFTTVDLESGQEAYVSALVLAPDDGPVDDAATLYLPSSAADQGFAMDLEAVMFANRLSPERRLVVLPLPIAEQRGAPWPSLAGADVDRLAAIARQAALDTRRAVDACQQVGFRIVGLAGYSLGGNLAAGVAGRHAEAFAGMNLNLFAAGGDLELLGRASDHFLAQRLARPDDIRQGTWHRKLLCLDPLTWARRSRVGSVAMVAGWRDEIIPVECSQALVDAYEAAGIPARITIEQGGHPLGESVIGVVNKLLERLQQP